MKNNQMSSLGFENFIKDFRTATTDYLQMRRCKAKGFGLIVKEERMGITLVGSQERFNGLVVRGAIEKIDRFHRERGLGRGDDLLSWSQPLRIYDFCIVALKTPTTLCSEVKRMPKGTNKHLFHLYFCEMRWREFKGNCKECVLSVWQCYICWAFALTPTSLPPSHSSYSPFLLPSSPWQVSHLKRKKSG